MIHVDVYSLRKGFRRIKYFTINYISGFIPNWIYRKWNLFLFSRLSTELKKQQESRIDYYFRLLPNSVLGEEAVTIKEFSNYMKSVKRHSTYYYDLFPIIRLFDSKLKFSYAFGDVNVETSTPAFTKARPIVESDGYSNSVIMLLDSVRHFMFIKDKMKWHEKIDKLVFRNVVEGKPHRIDYLLKTFDNPMCDSGEVAKNAPIMPEYVKPYMPIKKLLKYKFIACTEGNEVATNLKWVMSSNSIAVMPRPKFESWFMESTLIANYHYIEIKDDYSDISERLTYYINHPEEAEEIIKNANEYVKKFMNNRLEKWIQYEVVRRYLNLTQPGGFEIRNDLFFTRLGTH